tara:strand:+ start:201 stop:542 length:342 start_codon:yes stop_codon:yes gene_type:complete
MSIKKIITGLALLMFLSSGAANADVQDDRKAFIQKLITADVFQKIETPGSLPHLWVRPQFYSADFDTKNSFINVVYSYYYTIDPSYEMVVLYDSLSGKKIGTFNPLYGGLDQD